jgi:hypothetical protein
MIFFESSSSSIFLFEHDLRANAARLSRGKTGIHPRIKSEGMLFRIMLPGMNNCRPISGSKGGAYHPRKIRLAIGLGQQQHACIEMAVMDNGFVRIAGGEQYLQ